MRVLGAPAARRSRVGHTVKLRLQSRIAYVDLVHAMTEDREISGLRERAPAKHGGADGRSGQGQCAAAGKQACGHWAPPLRSCGQLGSSGLTRVGPRMYSAGTRPR